MLQIIYISTARRGTDAATLEAILEASRRNNRAWGVTGLLVSGGRRFLQALEGPDEAVEATLEKIRQDPRHSALVELSRRQIASRAFGTWAMAFEQGGVPSEDETLTTAVEELVAGLEDKSLRAQFVGFAHLYERAA